VMDFVGILILTQSALTVAFLLEIFGRLGPNECTFSVNWRFSGPWVQLAKTRGLKCKLSADFMLRMLISHCGMQPIFKPLSADGRSKGLFALSVILVYIFCVRPSCQLRYPNIILCVAYTCNNSNENFIAHFMHRQLAVASTYGS
jgi:hypothetical protein